MVRTRLLLFRSSSAISFTAWSIKTAVSEVSFDQPVFFVLRRFITGMESDEMLLENGKLTYACQDSLSFLKV